MSKKEYKNVPQLRFPEFEGNWQAKTLGELADWSSGGTPSKDNPDYWDGDIPWISASSMYGDIFLDSERKITELGLQNGSKLAAKGSILILVRGMILYKCIPVGITGRDLAFNQDIKCLKILDKRGLLFLFYCLKASENFIKSLVTITNVGTGKLDTSQLKTLIIFTPGILEQEKIASFLGSIDTRLTQLRRKHELLQTYKRGVMQKIFSQKLRFKDATGSDFPDWKEGKLGEFLKEYKERVSAITDLPIYSSSREGLKPQKEYFADRELVNEGEYGVVPDGFFVYRHMSDDLTFKFNINETGGKIVVSKEYPVFTTKNLNSKLLLYKLNHSNEFKQFAITQKMGGTRTRLYYKNLSAWKTLIPQLEEQEKIANFLTAIDKKIEAVAQQIDRIDRFKKGLLQKMFV